MSSIDKAIEKLVSATEQQSAQAQKVTQPVVEASSVPEPNIDPPEEASDVPSVEVEAQAETKINTKIETETADPIPQKNRIELDYNRLRNLGMLVPGEDNVTIAEEYRAIKRPLIHNIETLKDKPNLIMVTSSMPSEGKTFSAVNLALSMAMELNKWVMLVDFDIAKSGVSKLLGLETDLGVVNVLTDSSLSLPDVIFNTNVERLSILPAGKSGHSATELIASNKAADMMKELSSRYPDRIVIFDSPPLLATSEASVLASLMGQIVLVVESNNTPKHMVHESIHQLKGAPYIGLLLNKSNRSTVRYYYGYGSNRV